MGNRVTTTSTTTKTSTEQAGRTAPAVRTVRTPRTARYGATILLSAFLLFLVQPLMARYVLPWFGGGGNVWGACLLFFQGALIAGYAYAFALAKWLPPRTQALVHLVVVAAAAAMLPIAPDARWRPAPSDDPVAGILLLLLSAVGAPYVALATTGPLLQSWFARAAPNRSPWRLYALSNLGSLLALPAYPLLVERVFSRSQQSTVWSAGFVLFAASAAWCALDLLRVSRSAGPPRGAVAAPETATGRANPFGELAIWLLLAACGSTMLLAGTAVITDDVAPAPFLWVVPLGAYLISFIVAFEWPHTYRRTVFVPMLLVVGALVLAAPLYRYGSLPVSVLVLLHTAGVFVVCMVCHGELYRLRPAPSRLTTFYMLVAIGGAAGAAFVTLAAPRAFDGYVEHPAAVFGAIALVAVCMFRDPESSLHRGAARRHWLALAAAVLALAWLQGTTQHAVGHSNLVLQARSFYGVIRVQEHDRGQPRHRRELYHGRISHGVQYQEKQNRRAATSYYVPPSGGARAITVMGQRRPLRVGVIGLGAGTLAAFGRAGDVYRFYEINPDVIRVAQGMFTFLADGAARVEIVEGDARLSLEREPPQRYDVLIVDAFSGDAIPFHLLTREALTLYRRHVAADGVVALHLTNTYFDLVPLGLSLAADAGLGAGFVLTGPDERISAMESWWVLLSADATFFAAPWIATGLRPVPIAPLPPVWTDEHVRLLDALR